VGDAGVGHPDANVVSPIAFIWLLALTAIGRLAWRAHSSTRVRLHQIELPPSLPTCFYESRREAIGYFFTLLFLCGTNFKAYWTSSATEKSECLPTKPVHLGYAISDVITDVLTILLPIPEVT